MVGLPQQRKDSAERQPPVTTPCVSTLVHWAKHGYDQSCRFPKKSVAGLAEYAPDSEGNQVRIFTCLHCMGAGSRCLELPSSVTSVVSGLGNPLAFDLELAILGYHDVPFPGEMLSTQPSSVPLDIRCQLLVAAPATESTPAVTRGYKVVSGVMGSDLSKVTMDHVKNLTFATKREREEHFGALIKQLAEGFAPLARNLTPWVNTCRGHSGHSEITGGTVQFEGRAPRGKAALKRKVDTEEVPRSAGRKRVKLAPQAANSLVFEPISLKNDKVKINAEDVKSLVHNMIISAKAVVWLTGQIPKEKLKAVRKRLGKDFNLVPVSKAVANEMNEDDLDYFHLDEDGSEEEA